MKTNKNYILTLGIFIIILLCYSDSMRYSFSNNTNFDSIETEDDLKPSSPKVFSITADPPDSENWTAIRNDEFPIIPDNFGIDSAGCYISHEWDESVNASRNIASINWERNFNIPEDMSYQNITSASFHAVVNATVHANNGIAAGVDCPGDPVDHGLIFDYVAFYVLISDLENTINKYQIAGIQTTDLGNDTAGIYDFLPDTHLNTVSQEALKFCIGKVLESDHHNFTITLGMKIYCEDNYLLNDTDYWDMLRIKSFNLVFTYEELIHIKINEPESGQLFGEIAPQYDIYINTPNLDTSWYTLDNGITDIIFTELIGTINQAEWNKFGAGSITIRFYANDTLGSLYYDTVIVYKDLTAPVVSITSQTGGEYYDATAPSYTVEISDTNLDTMWYTIDGGVTNVTFTLNGTIDQAEWTALPDGPVNINFYTNDTVGNIGFDSVIVNKDTGNPIVSIMDPSGGEYFGAIAPGYIVEISDFGSPIDTMWYTINGGANIIFTVNGTIDQNSWTALADGSITIIFYASDSAGNINSDTVIVDKDATDPVVSITSQTGGEYYDATAPSYTVEISDTNLDTMWYTIDGGVNNVTFTLNGTIDQNEWTALGDGPVTMRFYANDFAGNVNFAQVIVNKDTSAPTINIISPLLDQKFRAVAPNFSVEINENNLDSMWYTINGGATIIIFTLNGTIDQTEWTALGDGAATIRFYANDSAGNVNFAQVIVNKDTSAPTIHIISPLLGLTFRAVAPSFIVEINDYNLDTMWYTIDGGATNFTFVINGTIDQTEWITLANGPVTIIFYANDTFGHTNYADIIVHKDVILRGTIGGYDLIYLSSIICMSIVFIIYWKKKQISG